MGKGRKTICDFYSPYQEKDGETMEDWYRKYVNDEERYIHIYGYHYARIVHRCRFGAKKGTHFWILYEPQDKIQPEDILMDEYVNEFVVNGFGFVRFGSKIPEWYPKIMPISITGKSCEIGSYLCKK